MTLDALSNPNNAYTKIVEGHVNHREVGGADWIEWCDGGYCLVGVYVHAADSRVEYTHINFDIREEAERAEPALKMVLELRHGKP